MNLHEKRKPGRPPLPRERIIDTALHIVDTEGAEALSLRALAEKLSSSTATLYRHVNNRAELVGLIINRVLADVELPPIEDDITHDWAEVCHRTATAVFCTLAEHRRVAPLLIERFPTGANAFALRDRLAAALLRGGFAPETAAKAVATLARFILGFAMQAESEYESPAPLLVIDEHTHPSLAKVSAFLPQPLPAEFEFGLDNLLSGLAKQRP